MYLFYIYHPDLLKPIRLKYDPVGWDGTGREFDRDPKWHGVFWKYTPKLQFVKDGRGIVHYFYEKYGIEAEITLTIYKKNRNTRKFDLNYTGRLNLTSLEISTLYATCNVEQTGFIQRFKNSQDIKVNVSSSGNTEVELHSKAILRTSVTDPAATIPEWNPRTSWYADGTCNGDCDSRQIVKYNKKYWKSVANNNKGSRPTPTNTAWVEVQLNEASGRDVGADFTGSSPGTYYLMMPVLGSPSEIGERPTYESAHISDLNPVDIKRYNFRMDEEGVYHFDIKTNWTLIASGNFNWIVQWKITYGREGSYITENIGTESNFAAASSLDGVGTYLKTLNLLKEDEVYVYGVVSISGNSGGMEFSYLPIMNLTPGNPTGIQYSYMNVTAETFAPATTTRGVLWHEAFSRIVAANTGQSNTFRSSYYGRTDLGYALDGPGALKLSLNGYLIRGFAITEKPVEMSFKQIFEASAAMDGVGIGIEMINGRETVVVEKLSYFYKPVRIGRIPYVRDIKKKVQDDAYVIQIDGGYDKWSNETLNNLDEVNAKREWKTSITQVDRKLNIRCNFITSPYTIEFMRRDSIEVSETKDNDRDNDLFVIQLRRDGGTLVPERNENMLLLNIFSPETTYNARLSPMRCLRRNGALIRSGLYHHDESDITKTHAEGNSKMMSMITGEDTEFVSEESIQVKKLDTALYIPEVYEFKVKMTRELEERIEAEPCGYIEFATDGKTWKRGFIINVKPDAKTNLTTFKLLRANF